MTMYQKVGNILKPIKELANMHDLKRYKRAKLHLEHMEAILKVTKLTLRGLERFEVYGPVKSILNTIRYENKVLEAHLEDCKKVINNKGKV